MDTGRLIEQATAIGRRNQEIIDLARRHCAHMEFPKWELGGRGMAEAATGLPIDTRRVHCVHASSSGGASANLQWVATEFYRANCLGCPKRQPTGEVPNLASVIDEKELERARVAEEEGKKAAAARDSWSARVERRRLLRASATPPMQVALADIDTLDSDPSHAGEASLTKDAMGRLLALAERAPETFTSEIVEHLAQIAVKRSVVNVIGILRRVANAVGEFRPLALEVAILALGRRPDVEAARCLVELSSAVDDAVLKDTVIDSLLVLAGQPEPDDIGYRAIRSATSEPAGLRLVADRLPDAVRSGIVRRLRRRQNPGSGLVLPPGLEPDSRKETPTDWDRCVAAGAVRSLASSHAQLAVLLLEDLALNLADDDEGYDLHAVADVQRSLAVLLVRFSSEVVALLDKTGEYASRGHRERLFGVLERAERLVDPDNRWREPSDPSVSAEERSRVYRTLLVASLARIDGNWGEEVAHQAAVLIARLTEDGIGATASDVPALIGALLVTLDRIDRVPSGRVVLLDDTPSELRVLEAASRRMTVSATAQRLSEGLSNLATVDPGGTVRAITDVLQSERSAERGVELAWRVLPILGDIGAKHGAQAGVLRAVLPILHTYLVHVNAAVRGAAITAWTTVASEHQVPSSLSDLLPVFVDDRYVAVMRSLLKAAVRLEWNDEDRTTLLFYAWQVASYLDASDKETLKTSFDALRALGGSHRLKVEALILKRAQELDGYALRDVLVGTWLPQSQVSPRMAALRLKLARDPRVNDRVNSRDDEELRALLDCGTGLRHLVTTDVRDAALDGCPEFPFWAAEYGEVLARGGRPADAAAIVDAALEATPAERVYESRRSFLCCIGELLRLDAALQAGLEVRDAARDASNHTAAFLRSWPDGERPDGFVQQLADRIALRCWFSGSDAPASLAELATALVGETSLVGEDSATVLRHRASYLADLRTRLTTEGQRRTPTGAYIRGVAELCEAAKHLVLFDAAELDASDSRSAYLTAAKRRANAAIAELKEQFLDDDPIGAPLARAFQDVGTITTGAQVAPLLRGWASLPVPLLFVNGPPDRQLRRNVGQSVHSEPDSVVGRSIAVALAHIDGRLITGPQVLRPETIYTLRIEVRIGEWPDWADRLDAELLTHINAADALTPAFTWRRSDMVDGSVVGEGTLIMRFRLGAGQPAPPFLLSIRFRGLREEGLKTEQCDVAGHRELRLRPFDASRDALTGYRIVDERLLALYERLHGAGYDEDQIQAFCRLLTAVCRAGLSMTWEKRYKRGQKVTEREFHDDLHERLLKDPELGGRVERNEPLALGYLDVRHDGITAELKVEKETAVTEDRAPKYMGQPTQYAAADGARLSILGILDMSSKSRPVGTPENYLWQIEPALHGLTNPEAPSLVTVVVINGNLPTPSSWSRGSPGEHRTLQ